MTRLARTTSGRPVVGQARGFVPLSATRPAAENLDSVLPAAAAGELDEIDATANPVDSTTLRFGRPLEAPGTIWGVGLNYEAHAADLGEGTPSDLAVFTKPVSTARGTGGPITLPSTGQTDRVTAEGELAVVIGRTCRNVAPCDVGAVVAGYLPIIDVTAEDILHENPRFLTRAKSFDSFLVLGPWIRTPAAIDSLAEIQVRTERNGRMAAANTLSAMRFSPAEVVASLSKVATLHPGDLICTGTPGATVIEAGDTVTAGVESVGKVSAEVVASADT
ncbi:MAG: fumarylacetoacetate hydrolase family protein [Halobacteriaceae archaeon]